MNLHRTLVAGMVLLLSVTATPGAATAADGQPVDAHDEALEAVNAIRSQAGLPAVSHDPSLQQGVTEHACWTVLNGKLMHGAIPGTPGYSVAADDAGRRSNIAASTTATTTATSFVDRWATGPYHAIGLLRPHLTSIAYGHCTGDVTVWASAGTLDVISHLGPPSEPRPLVTFPADGATTHLTHFVTESPNPLDNCGWSTAGLPIIAMLPDAPAPGTTATVTGPHGPVEVCVITAHDDVHPIGAALLEGDHAVVVIPRTPLTDGTWSVSIHAGQHAPAWSFRVDEGTQFLPSSSTRKPARPAKFVPVEPCRLIDTRHDQPGRLAVDQTVTVQATGRCDLPAGATSVAISLTAAGATRDGYLTVWPHGRARPDTSMLNVARGDTRANSGLVRLGDTGAIDVFDNAGGHLIVDVTGAFVTTGASRDGRFEPVEPERLLDTRDQRPLHAGETVTIPLPAGVPHDATAVAVNLTTTASPGFGYFTAFPSGAARPNASVLTTSAADQVRAASTIVPVSAAGLSIYSSAGGHLIVDVTGWFTSSDADETSSGLFVATDPVRLLDTRTNGGTLGVGDVRNVETGTPGRALVINTTTVSPPAPGFLTVYSANRGRPGTSAVNGRPGDATANLTIAPTDDHTLAVYTDTGGDVLLDRSGWFTE